ncbi:MULTISPECIES: type VI secretion system contractile sheath small subunit [unclassified Bartonella]|uniref:type VI secretion system contractile sheath small subunit n=1 Tax=unclassified Bartonella TaxID=2645622 RepID=UPI0021C65370|nr:MULTISPECIES: type VI secretion system contractile sheath small subunit [unclassified Bartonella]UXN05082.1 type VI secretion system contractile sheath small subunit [Bartonella sp. HY406]UXN08097.1 type VI secretion system contractile sheath small subunit [Bartonella sp. HY761]
MARGTKEGSVAPKERVNIKYTPATLGQQEEKELPLRMVFVGDFTGQEDQTPIEERKILSIDKNNFNAVMEDQKINIAVAVPNTLSANKDDELRINFDINSLDDFSPDAIAKKVPELSKLLELRDALNALKGPLGNFPSFRQTIQNIIDDKDSREKILKELAAIESTGATSLTEEPSDK